MSKASIVERHVWLTRIAVHIQEIDLVIEEAYKLCHRDLFAWFIPLPEQTETKRLVLEDKIGGKSGDGRVRRHQSQRKTTQRAWGKCFNIRNTWFSTLYDKHDWEAAQADSNPSEALGNGPTIHLDGPPIEDDPPQEIDLADTWLGLLENDLEQNNASQISKPLEVSRTPRSKPKRYPIFPRRLKAFMIAATIAKNYFSSEAGLGNAKSQDQQRKRSLTEEELQFCRDDSLRGIILRRLVQAIFDNADVDFLTVRDIRKLRANKFEAEKIHKHIWKSIEASYGDSARELARKWGDNKGQDGDVTPLMKSEGWGSPLVRSITADEEWPEEGNWGLVGESLNRRILHGPFADRHGSPSIEAQRARQQWAAGTYFEGDDC